MGCRSGTSETGPSEPLRSLLACDVLGLGKCQARMDVPRRMARRAGVIGGGVSLCPLGKYKVVLMPIEASWSISFFEVAFFRRIVLLFTICVLLSDWASVDANPQRSLRAITKADQTHTSTVPIERPDRSQTMDAPRLPRLQRSPALHPIRLNQAISATALDMPKEPPDTSP